MKFIWILVFFNNLIKNKGIQTVLKMINKLKILKKILLKLGYLWKSI